MTLQAFGTNLRARREAAGVSGNELSRRTGINQGNISKLETGKRKPSPGEIASIAERGGIGLTVEEMQAWADADRLGDERLRAVQEHVVAPQMTVDEWIEAIRRLPPEEKAKARAELEAVLKELEAQEGT